MRLRWFNCFHQIIHTQEITAGTPLCGLHKYGERPRDVVLTRDDLDYLIQNPRYVSFLQQALGKASPKQEEPFVD